jgi:type IV secretory pathway VirB4 component
VRSNPGPHSDHVGDRYSCIGCPVFRHDRSRDIVVVGEGRLDGSPTLLIVDEGWLALDDPTFGAQLREWLKTLRKKNASVVFATQSLADIETSALAPAIIESCPTRLFLPNERAIRSLRESASKGR